MRALRERNIKRREIWPKTKVDSPGRWTPLSLPFARFTRVSACPKHPPFTLAHNPAPNPLLAAIEKSNRGDHVFVGRGVRGAYFECLISLNKSSNIKNDEVLLDLVIYERQRALKQNKRCTLTREAKTIVNKFDWIYNYNTWINILENHISYNKFSITSWFVEMIGHRGQKNFRSDGASRSWTHLTN